MPTIFAQATRLKLRYKSQIGNLTTEDLWDLPLQRTTGISLDSVAIEIYEELEKAGKKSFVSKNKTSDILELKMDIIKYIIDIKLKEKENAIKALENKERKELLMDVIAEKEIDELKNKSVKDLKKEIKSL